MTLYLNREAMRLVKTNDKGRVTKRRRYKFGDEVDEAMFDYDGGEERMEALKEKGTLVESRDDLDKRAGFRYQAGSDAQRRGQATTVGGSVGAAGAGTTTLDRTEPTDEAESAALVPEPTHEDEPQGGGAETTTSEDGPRTEDGDDVEMVDEFASMDYSELQEAAKSRDLRYVGVGAEDLRASLREAVKSSS